MALFIGLRNRLPFEQNEEFRLPKTARVLFTMTKQLADPLFPWNRVNLNINLSPQKKRIDDENCLLCLVPAFMWIVHEVFSAKLNNRTSEVKRLIFKMAGQMAANAMERVSETFSFAKKVLISNEYSWNYPLFILRIISEIRVGDIVILVQKRFKQNTGNAEL